MQKFTRLASFFSLVLCLLTSASAAAGTLNDLKLAGHLELRNTKAARIASLDELALPPCNQNRSELNTAGAIATPYNLYLLALDVDPIVGLAGARLAIDYTANQVGSGLGIFSWQTNADTQIFLRNAAGENWPAPGAGNMLIFENPVGKESQPNDANGQSTAILGCFYVYAYGDATLEVVPTIKSGPGGARLESGAEPVLAAIRVLDGTSQTSFITYPDNTGTVVFGAGAAGRNPCVEWLQDNAATSVDLAPPAITVSASVPNPSTSRVSWSLTSTQDRSVDVRLYDVAGRLVRTWSSLRLSRGRYNLVWDGLDNSGRGAPSGKYYLRVDGEDGYLAVRDAVLLR